VGIRAAADFYAGLLFAFIGGAALWIARGYPAGTAARMGPGYTPDLLAAILLLIGVILVVRSLLPNLARNELSEEDDTEAVTGFAFRAGAAVLGAVLIFALIVNYVGLALSSIVLVIISRLAIPNYNVKEVLITAVCLSTLCVVLFVYGLGMSVAAFPF
jgi:hypothetical protein